MGLFRRRRRKEVERPLLVVRLNARLQPVHRGEVFEDPLDAHLTQHGMPASVTGGGTLVDAEGQPKSCDIEVAVAEGAEADVALAIGAFLESLGAPRGSAVVDEEGTVLTTFGAADGLALHLNGTDLPDEVYAASDINELVEAIRDALGDSGAMLSHWEGPEDTVLYLYGPSDEVMRTRLADLLATRPDAQLSRFEIITQDQR